MARVYTEEQKVARATWQRKYYAENKSRCRETSRRSKAKRKVKDPTASMLYQRTRYRQQAERFRAEQRRYRGLPEPVRPCPEACECCGKKQNKALHLDHDHSTGRFRGWLCNGCNGGIGMIGDSIEGAMNVVAYFMRHGAN